MASRLHKRDDVMSIDAAQAKPVFRAQTFEATAGAPLRSEAEHAANISRVRDLQAADSFVRVARARSNETTPPPSRIGTRVEAALRGHPLGKGRTWNVSTGNQLAGSGDRPWLIQSPPAPTPNQPLAAGHSDFLYNEVTDTIAQAKQSLVISTLAPPSPEYMSAINRSLVELNKNLPADSAGVDVRIHIGSLRDDKGVEHAARQVLDEVTRGLPANARLRVSVGTYAGQADSARSFNHAKMIIADGEAVVGGHNWWANEYNTLNKPVHDLSMRVKGPAAQHARDFFNYLWDYSKDNGTVVTREGAVRAPSAQNPLLNGEPNHKPGSRIISVGTTGGFGINASGTSDTALYAMIDGAEKSIRISAQDLASMVVKGRPFPGAPEMTIDSHLSKPLVEHLGRAMRRGVKVEVILSGDQEGGYSHGWSAEQTKQGILDHLKRVTQPRYFADIAKNLEVRPLARDGQPARNHSKMMMVDDSIFYVGSQNFYPGGMKEAWFTQLAEFGYIVDDAKAAAELKRTYWDPMWSAR